LSANQQFIDEPGLEGTSDLDPDLRADFLNGATRSLAFGFALNSGVESDDYVASLSVFDAAGNLLGSESVAGVFGGSDFPEGVVTVSFAGTAAYATFDFTTEFGRYIIDNFEGAFGSRSPGTRTSRSRAAGRRNPHESVAATATRLKYRSNNNMSD
jgi:hypothetical protein